MALQQDKRLVEEVLEQARRMEKRAISVVGGTQAQRRALATELRRVVQSLEARMRP